MLTLLYCIHVFLKINITQQNSLLFSSTKAFQSIFKTIQNFADQTNFQDFSRGFNVEDGHHRKNPRNLFPAKFNTLKVALRARGLSSASTGLPMGVRA